ncbi:hypothetical protein AGMMS49928_29530 [Spirochaetia bacterium]|nr:hypothetical protein AGMMS49928_29530 [Spirochaetia bacterium]
MAEMVRHTHTAGSGLTIEQLAEIEDAKKYPIVFDDDCPELTEEQLAEFRPVNFASWEERARAMRAAGIVNRKAATEPVLAAVGK